MRFRFALLAFFLVVACDATVTDIGKIDADLLAQVARIPDGSLTPAEVVLVDLLRSADSADGGAPQIPQLDSLFTLVTTGRSDGSAAVASRFSDIVESAWRHIDDGANATGECELIEARTLQSRVVADRLGTRGALGYVTIVSASLEHSDETVNARTPRRYRAMLESAFDLRDDARNAIRDGRVADAFDLASHAAGLANALAAGSVRN